MKYGGDENSFNLPSDEELSPNDMNPSTTYTESTDCDERNDTSPSRLFNDDLSRIETISALPQSLNSRRKQLILSREQSKRNLTIDASMDPESMKRTPADQNQIKLDLMEALRDKRAYAAACMSFQDQNSLLDKEVQQLKQDKLALQATLDNTRVRTKGKKPVWSLENLKGSNIDEFQGICLAAGSLAKKEASYVTTESYWDETERCRRRSWVGSTTVVTTDMASKVTLLVQLPNSTLGIPNCCMKRALEGKDYSSGFTNPKQFSAHCLEKILEGPVGSLMSESEKRACISKILAHKQTVQKFRGILSDAVGNRKKAALQVYLRTLGYKQGAKANSKHLTDDEKSSRSLERESAYSRVTRIDAKGDTSTMSWRLLDKFSLGNSVPRSGDHASIDFSDDEEESVDHFFMNSAAKRAFCCLRGYNVPTNHKHYISDVSILCLARADAYMTTMLKWIKIGGKGGIRNCDIRDCYQSMLPKAMSAIIKDVWDDLKEAAPTEMFPYIGNSKEIVEDPFGNNIREWTTVIFHPSDNCLYLLARPIYFRKMVCSWFGNIKDCHIGRCLEDDTTFTRIVPSSTLDEVEESDVEDLNTSKDAGRNNASNVEDVLDARNDNVSQEC